MCIRDSTAFRSPAAGPLLALVAHHVVRGRVVFPGAGYLELARAACCASAGAPPPDAAALRGVFFVQPLALDGGDGAASWVECVRHDESGAFEVRSGDAGGSQLTHCTGEAQRPAAARPAPTASAAARRGACGIAASADAQYDGLHAAGLEYGPAYRLLGRTWASEGGASTSGSGGTAAVAVLRDSTRPPGVAVHPAELDGALQLGAVLARLGGGGEGETLSLIHISEPTRPY